MEPLAVLVSAESVHVEVTSGAEQRSNRVTSFVTHSTSVGVAPDSKVMRENNGPILDVASDTTLILRRCSQILH